ncbi:hypothetical protein ACHAWF_009188 [Thalassiosira exigua]
MKRNTSFFWTSDDFPADDDPVDDDDEERVGVAPLRGGPALASFEEGEDGEEEEDGTDDSENDAPPSSPERRPLNVCEGGRGYGTAQRSIFGPPRERRKSLDAPPTTPGSGSAPAVLPRLATTTTTTTTRDNKSIRFQVVIWHIGTIDVQTCQVKMRFRLTLFWTDEGPPASEGGEGGGTGREDASADGDDWAMEGRQHAVRKRWGADYDGEESRARRREVVDVPPVSILNAVELDVADAGAEITMVDPRRRDMRWTCMYNATLFQGDHLSVKDFPHDAHHIKLKVGILAHRGKGGRWDQSVYHLALAGERDSKGSTRIPHGLVVDHCHVPDFGFDRDDLRFEFAPLNYGRAGASSRSSPTARNKHGGRDAFLQVTLPVRRQSCYYDASVLPTLVVLNVIAITCLTRNFASATAATEIMLSIAFVQVGIRLTLDSRLPSVGYPIKVSFRTMHERCIAVHRSESPNAGVRFRCLHIAFFVSKLTSDANGDERVLLAPERPRPGEQLRVLPGEEAGLGHRHHGPDRLGGGVRRPGVQRVHRTDVLPGEEGRRSRRLVRLGFRGQGLLLRRGSMGLDAPKGYSGDWNFTGELW